MTASPTPTGLPAPRHITYVPLSAVRPATRNVKIHGPEQIAGLRAFIAEVGFTQPCLIDERTQRLVAGHGRLQALGAMLADAEAAPEGILIDDTGEWLIPLIRGWSSRDDAEATAVLIADNRLTELGEWHNKTLASLLDDVQANTPALFEALAYTSDDLDELLRWSGDDDLAAQAPGTEDVEHALNAASEDAEMDGDGTTEESATPNSGQAVQCPSCTFRFHVGDRVWD